MHVGLATGFAHQRGKTYDDARFVREEIENLVLAEELGFDSVWITEHHFTDYSMSNDPVQLLTYIAARTRHVKLGTQCIIAPWHHPVRLAERIVNLDILSDGRAILGFGGGLAQHEFAGLGIDMNQSRQMYNDLLEVLIPALETGVIEGKGIYGNIPRSELRPGPIKSFEGRKFCGSLSGNSMYTAARLSLEQVKQCANSAHARGGVSGVSRRPASSACWLPGNWMRSLGMVHSGCWGWR